MPITTQPPVRGHHGFTLVELSIVLVILGLLVGGVLTGQSLIRAAELRAVGTEYTAWQTALHTFRDKYFTVPGDMANATSFWGKDNTNCSGHTGTAATPGTCNGNGNGNIDYTVANTTGEQYRFWQHLALAGLIEGSYSGQSGPGGNIAVFGTNTPRSKMSNAGWGLAYAANYAGDSGTYQFDYGNLLGYGGVAGSGSGGPMLKPEELWNIDTKIDDGRPAYGKIVSLYWANCTLSTTFSDFNKDYRLTNTNRDCAFYSPKFL